MRYGMHLRKMEKKKNKGYKKAEEEKAEQTITTNTKTVMRTQLPLLGLIRMEALSDTFHLKPHVVTVDSNGLLMKNHSFPETSSSSAGLR